MLFNISGVAGSHEIFGFISFSNDSKNGRDNPHCQNNLYYAEVGGDQIYQVVQLLRGAGPARIARDDFEP